MPDQWHINGKCGYTSRRTIAGMYEIRESKQGVAYVPDLSHARLIAASADLLAALEAMKEHFGIIGVGRKGSSIYEQAEAAIAKAKTKNGPK